MAAKPFLIIQPATSKDDVPALCVRRGDELTWFQQACGLSEDDVLAVRVHLGEPLPEPDTVRGVIITGAVDMVTDGHAWIESTAEWVRRAMAANVPILGVCFGHQLIAHAMGGEVGNNPEGPMFGNVPVRFDDTCTTDPLFGFLPAQTEMQVFHFQSVLRLPPQATVFATGPHDPHYAVRFGDTAWGVQFHPEFDAEIMEFTYDVYGEMIEKEGFAIEALRQNNRDCDDGRRLLQRFAEVAADLQAAAGR